MNGHDVAPVRDDLIRCAKIVLGRGPLHECGYCAAEGIIFCTEDHGAWFPETIIEALIAKRCVTVEGETPNRFVRLTS